MQWPSRAEYTEAVRDYPHVSLQDPKLKDGNPIRGKDNFVISDTGAFSIVFPIDMVSKTFALRCWVKDVGNAKNRYQEISAYLKQVNLPYFVDFEYVSEGILVNGTKYPITRMEWVEGVSIREFIEQNLQNAHVFKVVADEFQKMVDALHKCRIAHGDLQDRNILIKQNGIDVKLKLIDYDSLFVPRLRGEPEQILGLPEYQHPRRMVGGGKANKKVDYFSELVIYLSFLSLAEKPELWSQFKDKTERGLLFSKEDFENPDQSDIFQQLANLSPDVQQLTATLKDFCAKTSIDQLEPLEAVLPKPDANTYCNQGESFLSDERYDEALAEFQKAIDIKPNYARAHFGCGHVYRRTKQYTNAISAFQQAIKFKANYKEAYHGLGVTYFESGDNSKAEAEANKALRIDLHYQPARKLLDIIKSATSPPVSPPTSKAKSDLDPAPDPVPTLWEHITSVLKHITGVLKRNRHSVTTGTLGLALVVCFIAFLMQINAKDSVLSQKTELTKQLTQKESEIHQMGLEIQGLTSSVQALKNANQKLSRDNGELQKELDDRTSGNVITLRRQLNEQKKENQELQGQLIKKDTEIRQLRNDKAVALNENRKLKKQLVENDQGSADQTTTIQQLREEKTETLTENRKLREQLVAKTSEAKNLTARVQQLQSEKVETQRQNQKLQGENAGLTRQNRNLRNENEALRNQLDKAKQGNAKGVIGPEPPKIIQIQNNRNIVPRAGSRSNLGCFDFERGEYDKAVKQFKQAVRDDPKFAVAHYNLGCAYLEMKEYNSAVDAFDKAVVLDEKFKEAYYNRSLVYFRRSQFQKARQDATKILDDIDPNYRLAQGLLTAIENAQ